MKSSLSKFSMMVGALLLFAVGAQAQHNHSPITSGGNSTGNGNYGGGGWGSGADWGASPLGSGGFASSSLGYVGRRVQYEDPRAFRIVSFQNDGPFVPSTFMTYEEAVKLGQEQLAAADKAAQGEDTLSLGDLARTYRAGRVPTLRLQSRVLQDNAGRLAVCNLNGNDCHRP